MRHASPYIFLGIILALLCASLCVWQIHRAAEKTALITAFEQEKMRSPLHWAGQKGVPFTRLELQGTVDTTHILHLIGRFQGGQSGYHVVAPLQTNAGIVLLDFGWVPAATTQDKICLPEDAGTFICRVREFTAPPAWFLPQNNLETREFVRLSEDDVVRAFGAAQTPVHTSNQPPQPFAPFYCEVISISPAPSPLCAPHSVGNIEPDWHNHHMGYALTWAALALVGIFMSILGFRRRKEQNLFG